MPFGDASEVSEFAWEVPWEVVVDAHFVVFAYGEDVAVHGYDSLCLSVLIACIKWFFIIIVYTNSQKMQSITANK